MKIAAWLVAAAVPLLGAVTPDAALQQAVQSPARSPQFVARDTARHPAAELAFFGLRPDATVVEIWPGGGYWTEMLAPYLAANGTYIVALPAKTWENEASAMRKKLAGSPATYGHVKIAELDAGHTDFAPPGSVDLVLTFRNLHNWMEQGTAKEMLAAFYRALKPGGVLGIEDHRGDPATPQDPKADDGYVRQDAAVAMVEQAGFVLDGSSEMNANPKDTKHWPKGVWTLPPTFELGAKDHAKYAAIGEADNFVLRFKKPAS